MGFFFTRHKMYYSFVDNLQTTFSHTFWEQLWNNFIIIVFVFVLFLNNYELNKNRENGHWGHPYFVYVKNKHWHPPKTKRFINSFILFFYVEKDERGKKIKTKTNAHSTKTQKNTCGVKSKGKWRIMALLWSFVLIQILIEWWFLNFVKKNGRQNIEIRNWIFFSFFF